MTDSQKSLRFEVRLVAEHADDFVVADDDVAFHPAASCVEGSHHTEAGGTSYSYVAEGMGNAVPSYAGVASYEGASSASVHLAPSSSLGTLGEHQDTCLHSNGAA